MYHSYGRGTPEIYHISFMAKFKCVAVWCAQEKGNHKATEHFVVYESNRTVEETRQ
jgi:hypothetical protein